MNPEVEVLKKENAMLRYRVMAAELALYQACDSMRSLSAGCDQIIRKVHETNNRFPLGDNDSAGITRLTINAVKASVPGAAGLSDAEIVAKYLSPIQPTEVKP